MGDSYNLAWLVESLYAFVQTWPTPSRTAETLLVRREGEETVFLNELRHRTNTALRLRFPLSRREIPGVRAALGEEGIMEGRDYRGVPVLAALRTIPRTPWCIVAKVDKEEVFAPLRARALGTALFVAVLAMSASLADAFFWHRRRLAFTQEHLAEAHARRVLAERVAYLTHHANDIILLMDQDWRSLEANDRALETYGFSLEGLRGMTLRQLHAPQARAAFDQEVSRLEVQTGLIVETCHQRHDGSVFAAESSLRPAELDGRKYHQAIIRDITERKRAEEALRQSEEFNRRIVESSYDCIKVLDLDANLLSLSEGGQRLLGIADITPYLNHCWVEFWQETDRPQVREAVATACAGKVGRFQAFCPAATGEPRWWDVIITPICDAAGQPRQLLAISRDVTECKQAEAEVGRQAGEQVRLNAELTRSNRATLNLMQDAVEAKRALERTNQDLRHEITQRQQAEGRVRSEKLLADSLINSLPGIFYLFDERGRFLRWNANLERVTGYSPKELAALSPLDVFVGAEQSLIQQRIQAVFADGQADTEAHLVSKSGGRAPYYLTGLRVELNGQPCLLGVGLDITERKQAEEAVRESETRFRATFEQAAVGVALVATDGRWLRVNQKLCDIVGYTPEELLPLTFQDITHPDDLDADLAYVRQVLAGEIQTYTMEKRYFRKDGSIVWADLTVSLVREPSGQPQYFIAVVEDITERKQAEDEIRELNERLEQRVRERTAELQAANKELEAFSYSVSHDLRAPLRAIDGFARILTEDHAPRLGGEGQRVLGRRKSQRRRHVLFHAAG